MKGDRFIQYEVILTFLFILSGNVVYQIKVHLRSGRIHSCKMLLRLVRYIFSNSQSELPCTTKAASMARAKAGAIPTLLINPEMVRKKTAKA